MVSLFHFLFFISILVPHKGVIILDSKNKRIIKGNKNIYGCLCDPKIYDYYQIKKIKLYVTSFPDYKRPFDKLYYINCSIYSNDGISNSLISHVTYDDVKYDNFAKLFGKHLNVEVEPKELGESLV